MTFHDAWKKARMASNSRRKIYPPRVDDVQRYWAKPPPALSPRCLHVVKRMREGWSPRLNFGYHGNAEYLGIYIWEYLEIVANLDHPTYSAWFVDEHGGAVRR
jgi:hypothetical protein